MVGAILPFLAGQSFDQKESMLRFTLPENLDLESYKELLDFQMELQLEYDGRTRNAETKDAIVKAIALLGLTAAGFWLWWKLEESGIIPFPIVHTIVVVIQQFGDGIKAIEDIAKAIKSIGTGISDKFNDPLGGGVNPLDKLPKPLKDILPDLPEPIKEIIPDIGDVPIVGEPTKELLDIILAVPPKVLEEAKDFFGSFP